MSSAPQPAPENRARSTHPWLIVGLGNPGAQYAATPHNLGFMVVEALAAQHDIPLTKKTLAAHWGRGRLAGHVVILAQPQTYMNLSGQAVAQLLRYFALQVADLVVVHDDLDVPGGRLKLARGGGAGGHRGVLSIAATLGSPEFYRVKLGLGRPPAVMSAEDYVLRPFPREDWEAVAELVARAAAAVTFLITVGLGPAQNQFHGAGSESA
ncbi:MAG: aminoacyl-tRNA hydrolase [Desulfobaccales bacterium]